MYVHQRHIRMYSFFSSRCTVSCSQCVLFGSEVVKSRSVSKGKGRPARLTLTPSVTHLPEEAREGLTNVYTLKYDLWM